MAVGVRAYVEYFWVPDGGSGATLTTSMSNIPGYDGSQGPGTAPNAQLIRQQQAEMVPGGDTPTLGNLQTALTTLATDLGNQLTAAIVAQIDGWATGGG